MAFPVQWSPVKWVLGYLQRRNRAWLLTLFLAVGLLYLPFLGNPFFFEDLPFFAAGAARAYAHSFFHFDLRWLPYATLDWTAQGASDAVPLLFRLGNALLHVANVVLVFFLLRGLAAAVSPENDRRAVAWGAWFGALIFACHPVATYAAGYVVQRPVLLATLFGLAMLLAYLRAMLSGQARWLVAAVAAYFMAVFSEEHAVLLPAVAGAMTILLREQNALGRRPRWLGWGAFFGIGLLVALRAQGVFGVPFDPATAILFDQGRPGETSLTQHLLDALTQMAAFFKYLALWLAPNPAWMSVDMPIEPVSGWSDWRGWAAALGFAAWGALGARLLLRGGRAGLAGLALLYPWLLFIAELFSARAQDPFVLYRSYLWMPGLMALVALLPAKWPGWRTLLGLGLVVLLLAPLAWNRLWVAADEYRLWNDAAMLLPSGQAPGAERILFNRAMVRIDDEQWPEAAAEFEHVVALYPNLVPARQALGMAYLHLDRFEAAAAQFDAGLALDPGNAGLYFGKGLALIRLHRGSEGVQLMKKACELGHDRTACWAAGVLSLAK